MAKLDTGLDEKLFQSGSTSHAQKAPMQMMVPIPEDEIKIGFGATLDFQNRLHQYFSNHRPELRQQGIKTLKALIVSVLEAHMEANS